MTTLYGISPLACQLLHLHPCTYLPFACCSDAG